LSGDPSTLPPQDEEAEEQVLGALLVDDLAIGQVAGLLAVDDFWRETHRIVYAAMLTLHDRNQPTDISLVRAELEQRQALDKIDGVATLVRYLNAAPTAVNVLHYAGVVADRALRRRLLQASARVALEAWEAPTAEAAAQASVAAVATASQTKTVGRIVDFSDLVSAVWDETSKAIDAHNEGEVVQPGLVTGLADLDRITDGMRAGELILLAARPSVGKTSLAMQIVVDCARRDAASLFFSLEMPGKDIAARALWQHARLNGLVARKGMLDPQGIERLANSVGALAPFPIRVDDTPGLPVSVLVSRARAQASERPLRLIVVDYLQLLKGAPRRDGNRTSEVTEISASLKALARDLDCPVLALSQLNRQVEQRVGARPQLSDLRDSGSLEQDADQVWLMWRDDPNVPIASIAVAKNRSGPTGALDLRWDQHSTRFDNLAHREE
jgi:replicative DNA helicase